MKKIFDYADLYIQRCGIKDIALLKICLCAVGIMIGLSIPEKKRKWPVAAAGVVFVFSYMLIMAEFLKIVVEERMGS